MIVGNQQATTGMAKNVYQEIDAVLRPPMEDGDVPEEAIEETQEAWKKLGYAIAAGVIDHFRRDPPGEPEFAEPISSSVEDPTFWEWLERVHDWLDEMASWQASVVLAFENWAPVGLTDQTFREEVLGLAEPGAPPAICPTSMKGKIE